MGIDVDPAELRKRLRTGSASATLVISRTPHGALVAVVERVTTLLVTIERPTGATNANAGSPGTTRCWAPGSDARARAATISRPCSTGPAAAADQDAGLRADQDRRRRGLVQLYAGRVDLQPDRLGARRSGLHPAGFRAGCAVHTQLPAGVGYTSIEIKINYLRGVSAASGLLTAHGWVTKPGRRVAFVDGDLRDGSGRLVATATGSCLIIGPDPASTRCWHSLWSSANVGLALSP